MVLVNVSIVVTREISVGFALNGRGGCWNAQSPKGVASTERKQPELCKFVIRGQIWGQICPGRLEML